MRIKTIINGKEIEGYWNKKIYPSKKGDDYIRIYIDNKEYNIPKNEFKYEEILTEKQLNYAETLKEKFLEKLKKIKNNFNKLSEEDFNIIYKYFEEKPNKYYLDNNYYLDNILQNIIANPKIIKALINNNIESIYTIVEKRENINFNLNELIKTLLINIIKKDSYLSLTLDNYFKIYENDDYFYIRKNTIFYKINKKTFDIEDISYNEIPKNKKFIAEIKIGG